MPSSVQMTIYTGQVITLVLCQPKVRFASTDPECSPEISPIMTINTIFSSLYHGNLRNLSAPLSATQKSAKNS
jgi:hypothetical protein